MARYVVGLSLVLVQTLSTLFPSSLPLQKQVLAETRLCVDGRFGASDLRYVVSQSRLTDGCKKPRADTQHTRRLEFCRIANEPSRVSIPWRLRSATETYRPADRIRPTTKHGDWAPFFFGCLDAAAETVET